MDATAGARLLKPVTETIMHEGAPFVWLSPHKGMRNAAIIYEAIRQVPDCTLIRGDFDKRSRPLVYFAEKLPMKTGTVINARNIEADRRELSSFLSSIVDAAYRAAEPHSRLIKAAGDLKLTINSVNEIGRDFTAMDIKKSLHAIAKAYALESLRARTSPHRLVPGQGSQIQGKRFRDFVKMDLKKFHQLAKAIQDKPSSDDDPLPMIAVFEIKQLLKDFLEQPANRKTTFSQFLKRREITPYQRFFAKRWREISGSAQTEERKKLVIESWSFEMDKVCLLIEAERRRRISAAKLGDEIGSPEVRRQPSRLMPELPAIAQAKDAKKVVADNEVSRFSPRTLMFSPISPETPDDERELERALLSASELPKLDLGQVNSVSLFGEAFAKDLALSPNQVLEQPLLLGSVHGLNDAAVPDPQARPIPVTAQRQPNPLYTRSDLKLFEADRSDELNQLHSADSGSQSDLLRNAFVPRVLLPFATGKATARYLLQTDELESLQSEQQSDVIVSESQSEAPRRVSKRTAQQITVDTHAIPTEDSSSLISNSPLVTRSRLMMHPETGYSPLDSSTKDEDQ